MTTKTEKSIVAIPTVYKGIQLRSRMEAQCAFMFDAFGWQWEYEPKSFMLGSGVPYRPDFWLPEQSTFFECRGYGSDRGRKQMSGFADFVRSQNMPADGTAPEIKHYVVLMNVLGGRVTCGKSADPKTLAVLVVFCLGCSRWKFADWMSPGCLDCGPSMLFATQAICAVSGKLYANGLTPDNWDFKSFLERGEEK